MPPVRQALSFPLPGMVHWISAVRRKIGKQLKGRSDQSDPVAELVKISVNRPFLLASPAYGLER